jgi:hypothetical protein
MRLEADSEVKLTIRDGHYFGGDDLLVVRISVALSWAMLGLFVTIIVVSNGLLLLL